MTPTRFARFAALAALLAAAWAGAAGAQAPRRDSLTLYEGADYRGASVTFYGDNANIGSTGFADRARSAQVVGQWRLCAGGGYQNGCQILQGNVRDLAPAGLSTVGSAQRLSGVGRAADAPRYQPPAPAPDWGPPPPVVRTRPTPLPAPPPSRPAIAAPRDLPPPLAAQAAPYAPGYAPPYEPGYGDAPPVYGAAAPYGGYGPPAVDAPPPARRTTPPVQVAPPVRSAPPAHTAPPVQAAPPPEAPPFNAAAATGGVDGVRATFFPRPIRDGYDLSASGIGAADSFCRSQGLGAALYFDSTQRATYSLDARGQAAAPGAVLRDVLCRRF